MQSVQGIEILHEDPMFWVVNKPSGLLTQSTWGVDSLQTILRKEGGFVELPHRLDRGTSGAIIVARTQRALVQISEQFHHRRVTKKYLAAIPGRTETPTGQWIDWMRKIPDVARGEIVVPEADKAREAIMDYEQLFSDANYSILQVSLQTGRMHQIRLQFSSRGMPVLGDADYGSTEEWVARPPEINAQESTFHEHFALHAYKIEFHHPKTAKKIAVKVPVPEPWITRFPEWSSKLNG